MTDNQSKLLTLPPRYHNPQQPKQVLEKLSIQLHPLPHRRLPFRRACAGPLSRLRLQYGGGLLLGDGIADAIDEREEECQIDGPRDLGSMSEVEIRQGRYELFDGLF